MSNDYGIKVMKEGKAVTSSDFRDLVMHSNMSMFKYHSDTAPTMTLNAGDTEKTISFAHGLGYVPAFIAYMGDSGGISMLPNRRAYYFVGADEHIFAYADSTNIYITWRSTLAYNQKRYYASDFWNTYDNSTSYFEVGREGSTGYNGALRFNGVQLNASDTIIRAKINIECTGKVGDTSRHMRWRNYGIREANTDSFNNPMGRTKTSATNSNDRTVPSNYGDHVEVEFIAMLNEIKGLGGWASGNAVGFLTDELNSDNDAAFWSYSGSDTFLDLTVAGSLVIPFRVIVFKDKLSA